MTTHNGLYTPSSLDDFTFSDPLSRKNIYSIVEGKVTFPGYKTSICLWGTNGTGKTELAKLLPILLDANAKMPPAKHGASLFQTAEYWNFTCCGLATSSVSFVKDLFLRTLTNINSSPRGYFYEILDEADVLGIQTQKSLKALITESSDATVYIMTTNNPQDLDRGVRDRSYMIEMNQPSAASMVPIGQKMLRGLGVGEEAIDVVTLQELAKASNGSYRDFGAAIQEIAAAL